MAEPEDGESRLGKPAREGSGDMPGTFMSTFHRLRELLQMSQSQEENGRPRKFCDFAASRAKTKAKSRTETERTDSDVIKTGSQ